VQHGGRDDVVVVARPREHRGHLERVQDEGCFISGSPLAAMVFFREGDRVPGQREVVYDGERCGNVRIRGHLRHVVPGQPEQQTGA